MAIVLACSTGQGRSLHAAAIIVFMQRFPVPEGLLRQAILWVIDTAERRSDKIRNRGDKAVEQRVTKAKTRAGADHRLLLGFTAGARPSTATLRKRVRVTKEALRDAAGYQTFTVLENEVPEPYVIVDWLQSFGLEAAADAVHSRISGEQTTARKAFAEMRQAARGVPLERLQAGRAALDGWVLTYSALADAVHRGEPSAVSAMAALHESPVWPYWVFLEHLIGCPRRTPEVAMALMTLASIDPVLEICSTLATELAPVACLAAANAMTEIQDNELTLQSIR
jgi:hypothetical protein